MGSNSTASKKSFLCFNFCFLASYFEHKSSHCSVALFKKASHLRLFSATVVLWLGAWLLGVWIRFGSKL